MNPKKLRYVTRHFYDLQGLRLLPLGLIVFTNSYRGTPPPLLNTVFSLALLGIILWLYRPITRFYREQYGHVKTDQRWYWQTLGLAAIMIGGLLADIVWAPPVSVAGLAAGVYLAVLWRPQIGTFPGLRWYYAVAGLAVVGGTLYIGLAGGPRSDMFMRLTSFVDRLAGVALVACGLLDHFLLTRTLGADAPQAPSPQNVAPKAAEAGHA